MLDAGRDEAAGVWFCICEPLVGRTLAQELATRGRFAWPEALSVLGQVADALRAAHARGMVHGELSPEGILVLRARSAVADIEIKLLDLALAASARAGGDRPRLPQADTPGYGALALALLTGNPAALASRGAPELGEADGLPLGFAPWLGFCTDADPQKRFPHATAAYHALASLAPGAAASARPRVAQPRAEPAPTRSRPPILPPPLPAHASRPVATLPSDRPVEVVARTAAPPPRPSLPAPGGFARPGALWTALRGPIWSPRGLTAFSALLGVGFVLFLTVRFVRAVPAPPAATASLERPGATAPVVLLRLHGSNTIGADLAPALAEAFLRHRPGAGRVTRQHPAPDETLVEAQDGEAIEIAAHGSATAFEDLGAGRCDIGMSSRRIRDDEATRLAPLGNLASAASEQVIAMDGIAVIVNPANPVSSLTRAQIAAIFAGRVRRWSGVGGRDDAIVVHARDARSGTYDTFKHLVLSGGEVARDAVRHESSEELSDAVADDPRAIGFIGLPYVRSAKAVMVEDEGSAPTLPSAVTVSTEDYPLSRRLYFYVPRAAPAVARELVDFAQSEEGQRTVASAGFVDLRPACAPAAETCAGCTAEYREVVRGAGRISTDFRFDRSSAQLDTRAVRDLQRVGALLARPEFASKSLLLLGFSDAVGGPADNLALSQRRASSVAGQLRARGLLVGAVRGFGSAMPVSDNATEEGRNRNRRVEVWAR